MQRSRHSIASCTFSVHQYILYILIVKSEKSFETYISRFINLHLKKRLFCCKSSRISKKKNGIRYIMLFIFRHKGETTKFARVYIL